MITCESCGNILLQATPWCGFCRERLCLKPAVAERQRRISEKAQFIEGDLRNRGFVPEWNGRFHQDQLAHYLHVASAYVNNMRTDGKLNDYGGEKMNRTWYYSAEEMAAIYVDRSNG